RQDRAPAAPRLSAQLKKPFPATMDLGTPSDGETAYVGCCCALAPGAGRAPLVLGLPAALPDAAGLEASSRRLGGLRCDPLDGPTTAVRAAPHDLVRRRLARRALRDRPGLLRRIVPEAAPPGQDPRGLSEGTGARPGPGAAPGRGRRPWPPGAGLCRAPGRGRLCPPGLRWHAPELPAHP